MARKKVYDKMDVEGPVVLMSFPMLEGGEYPKYPKKDEQGRRIVNVCELLKANRNNRFFERPLSERYSEQMVANEWDFELPVVVYVDWFGDMHNCQHVCNAIMLAEAERTGGENGSNATYYAKEFGVKGPIAVAAVLVTGINPASADFLDIGKQRGHADIYYRQHNHDDITIAKPQKDGSVAQQAITPSLQKRIAGWAKTAAKIVHFRLWYGEKVRSSRKFNHANLLETLKLYPGLKDSLKLVFEQNTASDGGIAKCMNPGYMAALHYLAAHSDADGKGAFKEHADYLVDVIANGSMNDPGSPFYELREWLLSQHGAKGNDGLNRLYDAVVYGWNQYLDQKKIPDRRVFSKLKSEEYWCMGGLDVAPTPEPEPIPEPVAPTPAPAAAPVSKNKGKGGKGATTVAPAATPEPAAPKTRKPAPIPPEAAAPASHPAHAPHPAHTEPATA